MKNLQILMISLLSSIVGGICTLGAYTTFFKEDHFESFENNQKAVFARYFSNDTSAVVVPEGLNFITASNIVRPTVVHIKTTYEASTTSRQSNPHLNDPFFRFFFDEPGGGMEHFGPRQSSGSGVIISENGYIVTNNHVIDKASKIEVVLDDKRKYQAKLIGKDPETDLALLKIDENNLPFARYGNSDRIKIGEWVLACGNPFDLSSTITAGIVSAKGRNINLLRGNSNYAIESFIQTDAAVNPGNSGGALVNLKGELIGINTAIASPNGAFAGYSFAVPVTLVKKVMDDLLKYGEVQRALLGVMIQDVTSELAKEKNLDAIKGVYVGGVNEGSAAKDAGIKEGDVILKIEGIEVNSASELQENVAQHRPGDKIAVTYKRNKETKTTTVTLKNKRGNTAVVKDATALLNEDLGVELAALQPDDKKQYKLEKGVKVTKILNGKLKEAGVKPGFVITKIDKTPIASPEDVTSILSAREGGVLIEGVYADGTKGYYAIGW